MKRAVWDRDGGQCAFIGTRGRCAERGFLEYHHAVPFAGGGATTADNLELRCRAHNSFEAERWFGAKDEELVRERRGTYGSRARSSLSDGGDLLSLAAHDVEDGGNTSRESTCLSSPIIERLPKYSPD